MSAPRGFTLFELIVVMAIIGITAWLAYPKLSALDDIKLDAAARRVAADLRYAQNRAIGKRSVHGVLFEPSTGRYTVFSPTTATPVTDPANPARVLRVDFLATGEFKGITISSASFGTSRGVTFDYFGVPRDTAGVDLAATGRVILTYKGGADTIDVTPGTGKVIVR
jgi:prepilin-type N-terminal cleavage/methylation domain-containing protein